MQQPPPGGWQTPPPGGLGAPQQYGQQNQQQQQFGPQYGGAGFAGYTHGRCPRCQSPHVTYPTFTWWGGIIGPKILSHAVCGSCQHGFNSKTGSSNTTAIAVYMGLLLAIGFGILVVFALAR